MTRDQDKTDILIVDDDTQHLLSLGAILEAPGYRIVTARSGRKALDLIQDHDFAVVILDVSLPDMDGFEAAEKIRLRKKTRHVPIMFLTDMSGDESWVFRGYMAGAVDYMVKPVDPVIIESKVNVFAELYRLRICPRLDPEPPLATAERQHTRQRRAGTQGLVLATLDCLLITGGDCSGKRLLVALGLFFGDATLADDLGFTDEASLGEEIVSHADILMDGIAGRVSRSVVDGEVFYRDREIS